MAVWRGKKKLNSDEIDSSIKQSHKKLKDNVKLFGPTKKVQQIYDNLNTKSEQADMDSFRLKSPVKPIKTIFTNDSNLANSFDNMEKAATKEQDLSIQEVKKKNPLVMLKELWDARKEGEDLLKDAAYNAGLISTILNTIRDLFRNKAKDYLAKHKEDNQTFSFGNLVDNLKETIKHVGKNIFSIINDKESSKKTASEGLADLFNKAYNYISFKAASYIANIDLPELQDKILKNSQEITGKVVGLNLSDMVGGSKDVTRKKIKEIFFEDKSTFNSLKNSTGGSIKVDLLLNIESAAKLDVYAYQLYYQTETDGMEALYRDLLHINGLTIKPLYDKYLNYIKKINKQNEYTKIGYEAYLLAKNYAPYQDYQLINEANEDYKDYLKDLDDRKNSAFTSAAIDVVLNIALPGVGKTFKALGKFAKTAMLAKKAGKASKLAKVLSVVGKAGSKVGRAKELLNNASKVINKPTKYILKSTLPEVATLGTKALGTTILESEIDRLVSIDESLNKDQQDAITNLLGEFTKDYLKNSAENAIKGTALNLIGGEILNKSKALKIDTMSRKISAVLTNINNEDFFEIPEENKDISLSIEDIFNYINITIDDNNPWKNILGYQIKAKHANTLIKLYSIYNTFQDYGGSFKKRLKNDLGVDTEWDLFKQSVNKTFTKDNLMSLAQTFNPGFSDDDVKVASEILGTYKKFKEDNQSENDDLDLDEKDSDIKASTIKFEEPRLIYGFNKAGYDNKPKLSGTNSGDIFYIIKRVHDLDDKITVLIANLMFIPADIGNPSSSLIQFEDIRKYSAQLYNYYKNAKYKQLTEEEMLNLKYIIYCLNGVDFTFENFLFAISSGYWTAELEELTYSMFNIVNIEGKPCIVSSSASITPEPFTYDDKIIKDLINKIKELAKTNNGEDDVSIDLIQNLDDVLNIEPGKNITIVNGESLKSFLDNDIIVDDSVINTKEEAENIIKKYRKELDLSIVMDNTNSESFIKEATELLEKSETPFDYLEKIRNELSQLRDKITDDVLDSFISKHVLIGSTIKIPIKVNEKTNEITESKEITLDIIHDLFYEQKNKNMKNDIENSCMNYFKKGFYIASHYLITNVIDQIDFAKKHVFNPNLRFTKEYNEYVKNYGSNVYNNYNTLKNYPYAFSVFNHVLIYAIETYTMFSSYFFESSKTKTMVNGYDVTDYSFRNQKLDILKINTSFNKLLRNFGDFKKFTELVDYSLNTFNNQLTNSERNNMKECFLRALLSVMVFMHFLNEFLINCFNSIDKLMEKANKTSTKNIERFKKFHKEITIGLDSIREKLDKLSNICSSSTVFVSKNLNNNIVNSSLFDKEQDFFIEELKIYYNLLAYTIGPCMGFHDEADVQAYEKACEGVAGAATIASAIIFGSTGVGLVIELGVGLYMLGSSIYDYCQQDQMNTAGIDIGNKFGEQIKQKLDFSMEQYGYDSIINGEFIL